MLLIVCHYQKPSNLSFVIWSGDFFWPLNFMKPYMICLWRLCILYPRSRSWFDLYQALVHFVPLKPIANWFVSDVCNFWIVTPKPIFYRFVSGVCSQKDVISEADHIYLICIGSLQFLECCSLRRSFVRFVSGPLQLKTCKARSRSQKVRRFHPWLYQNLSTLCHVKHFDANYDLEVRQTVSGEPCNMKKCK